MRKIFSLDECAILEAASRGLQKAGKGKHFDLVIFNAVAETELTKMRKEIASGEERA